MEDYKIVINDLASIKCEVMEVKHLLVDYFATMKAERESSIIEKLTFEQVCNRCKIGIKKLKQDLIDGVIRATTPSGEAITHNTKRSSYRFLKSDVEAYFKLLNN